MSDKVCTYSTIYLKIQHQLLPSGSYILAGEEVGWGGGGNYDKRGKKRELKERLRENRK